MSLANASIVRSPLPSLLLSPLFFHRCSKTNVVVCLCFFFLSSCFHFYNPWLFSSFHLFNSWIYVETFSKCPLLGEFFKSILVNHIKILLFRPEPTTVILIALVSIGLFYLVQQGITGFSPEYYSLPAPPKLEGKLAPNTHLAKASYLLEDYIKGPESLLVEGGKL